MARTNLEWLQALGQTGETQNEALEELRTYLFRAVLVYLRDHRSDLADWSQTEIYYFAEDMAQESVTTIRQNLESFRGDSKFTTWAYRLAINLAANELRLSRYRELSLEDLQEQETSTFGNLLRDDQGLDPGLAAERHACIELIGQIIRSELTEHQRLALVGVHFQGRSMEEVARQLGITRNALYKLLHDARRKIRIQLEEHHLGPGDILGLFEI